VKKSPSLRVLIVDDEPLIRWSLSETLSDAGHLVEEAGDGESALRTITGDGPFDVVVLDYHLPDSHDLTLLATIRQAAPDTAVVMMTAYGTPEMVAGAVRLGVYRIVPKPFEVHDMADLVLQAHASLTASESTR
jgi:DNA-binding NtrC family response regulator